MKLEVKPFPHEKLVQADDLEAFKAAFADSGVEDLMSWITADKFDAFSWSILHFVVGNNALKILDWVLDEVAAVISKQSGDDKDLRNAYVKLLTTKSLDNEIPLHLAAQEGHIEIMARLLSIMEDKFAGQIARLQCGSKNSDGSTPLLVAIEHVGGKPTEKVEKMLELLVVTGGSNLEAQDASGMDVFGAAKFMTNRGPEIEKILRKLKRSKASKAAPRTES
ncbi:Hypothetical protein (Fragment) [Durusdinium trenchii]|uniref:Ankyrin repeat domain-containing protein n=1 Tax=Durusdinium trenchii TaxID=1381693 RepID=A0ABP0L9H7_9DINO